jgi:hypothetical protein
MQPIIDHCELRPLSTNRFPGGEEVRDLGIAHADGAIAVVEVSARTDLDDAEATLVLRALC